MALPPPPPPRPFLPIVAGIFALCGAVAVQAAENPFTRTSFEPASPRCAVATLEPSAVSIENRCDHAIAVLTAPLEVRVRRTGKEKFVHERMSSTVYALLYVVSARLGKKAFRGDGVMRDGGLQVRREPAYVTIGARQRVKVPMRCTLDLPPGRYTLTLLTYEAPQGDAPPGGGSFDCRSSVAAHDAGAGKAAPLSMGADVRELIAAQQ